MNMNQMCVLRTGGLYMSEELMEGLYLVALSIVEEKQTRRDFKLGDQGEGSLSTNYRTVALGHFGGLKFEGVVEVGSRTFKVDFIIDLRYLHEFVPGYWSYGGAPPETDPKLLN